MPAKKETTIEETLLIAAQNGDLDQVKLLLEESPDVNYQAKDGKCALINAARKGFIEVVKLLLEKGANVNATMTCYALDAKIETLDSGSWVTARVMSVNDDYKYQVDLGECYTSDNVPVYEIRPLPDGDNVQGGVTAFLLAAEKGYFEVAELLLKSGADVNNQYPGGRCALMHAAEKGNLDFLNTLLAQGASVDLAMSDGMTALHFAASKSHLDCVEALINAGANVNLVGKGKTALILAALQGVFNSSAFITNQVEKEKLRVKHSEQILKLLVTLGANVNPGVSDKSPLEIVVLQDKVELALYLMSAGAVMTTIHGVPTVSPLFTLDANLKFKTAMCSLDFLTPQVLQNHNFDMWHQIIQVTDDHMPDLVRTLVTRQPELACSKDNKGRSAVDIATPAVKFAINSVTLWFGKYRPAKGKPEHTSATCFVFKAMDESSEEPVPVALKLMRVKAQFQRETEMRKYGFDADCVMSQTECYPDRPLTADDPDVVEVSSAEELNGTLTKVQAERLYCVVMPLADRNMFVAMKQERFAGKEDVSEVVSIFSQLVKCVSHMHGKGVLHGDIKTMNMVRMGGKWILIDLDACCVIGRDPVGFKSSSAYVPPEAVFADVSKGIVGVKSLALCEKQGIAPLIGHESFDVWSLGCILYQLCSAEVLPLFSAGQDDNLNSDINDTENSLWSLSEWRNKLKEKKLSKIRNLKARNLLSLMLSKDPFKRPTLSRVLGHPFLSGDAAGRMAGEAADFDVFISYRVSSDLKHATKVYDMLTAAGLRVWWDKKCLESGKEWQKGFCQGLGSSAAFLCILSKAGTEQPFQALTVESRCDNVLLEHRLALELKRMDYIHQIFPIMIGHEVDTDATSDGEKFASYRCACNEAKTHVKAVEEVLSMHLDQLGLGTPLRQNPTVHEIANDIRACNGYFIGGKPENTFEKAVLGIVSALKSNTATTAAVAEGDTMTSSKSVSALRSMVSESKSQEVVPLPEYEVVVCERDQLRSKVLELEALVKSLQNQQHEQIQNTMQC